MAEFRELAEQYNQAPESEESLEYWIPANHVISNGVLGIVKSGIIFITRDYSSELKIDRWTFDRIRRVRLLESLISPQIILDLKDKNLYFRVVNPKDAKPFKSAADAMLAPEKTAAPEEDVGFDIEEIEIEPEFMDFEEPEDETFEDASESEPPPETPKYSAVNDSYNRTPKIIGCLALIVILLSAGWFIRSVVMYLKDVDVNTLITAGQSGGKSVQQPRTGSEKPDTKAPFETRTDYAESARKIAPGKILFHSFEIGSDFRLRAIKIPMAGIGGDKMYALPGLKVYTARMHIKRSLRPDMEIASPIRKKIPEEDIRLPGAKRKARWVSYEFGNDVILENGTYWIGLSPNPEETAEIQLFKDRRAETESQKISAYDIGMNRYIHGGDEISFIISGGAPSSGKPLWAEPAPGVYLVQQLSHEISTPAGIAAGPNGEIALIGNNTVKRWDSNRILLSDIQTDARRITHAFRFSPDGTSLVWASDKSVKWAPFDRPEDIREFETEGMDLSAMDISPDGDYMITGKLGGRIQIWDISENASSELDRAHTGAVRTAAVHPSGNLFATGGDDLNVRLWSMNGEEIAALKAHWDQIAALCFSPDGKMLVSGSVDGDINVWDLSEYTLHATLQTPAPKLTSMVIAPDGKTLFAASANRTVSVWDMLEFKEIRRFKVHSPYIQSMYSQPALLALSPDGRTLVSTAGRFNLNRWRLDYEKLRNAGRRIETASGVEPPGHPLKIDFFVSEKNRFHGKMAAITESAVSPAGEIIAVASKKGGIEIWTADGELIGQPQSSLNDVRCLAVSPDDKLLAAGGDGGIEIRDINQQTEPSRFSEDTRVYALAFSADAQRLAAGNSDGSVVIWDAVRQKQLKRFEAEGIRGMNSAALSRDDTLIAAAAYKNLYLWNVQTGALAAQFEDLTAQSPFLDFIPGTSTLLAASRKGVVKIGRDGETEINEFDLFWNSSGNGCFFYGGKLMALAESDIVLFWDVDRNRRAAAFKTQHAARIHSLGVAEKSGDLITIAENNTVQTWRADREKILSHAKSASERHVLYETGPASSSGGAGLGFNGKTEYFELEQRSKIDRIEFHMQRLNITDPYSYPALRIRKFSEKEITAAAVSAGARGVQFKPTHFNNLHYWVGFNFAGNLILEPGKYEIELKLIDPDRAGYIALTRAEKDPKRCLFRVLGDRDG